METFTKFSEWLQTTHNEVLDISGRGSMEDANAEVLRNFEAMIKRDGGISDAVKMVYKNQMTNNPEIIPQLQAIVKKHKAGIASGPAATPPAIPASSNMAGRPGFRSKKGSATIG